VGTVSSDHNKESNEKQLPITRSAVNQKTKERGTTGSEPNATRAEKRKLKSGVETSSLDAARRYVVRTQIEKRGAKRGGKKTGTDGSDEGFSEACPVYLPRGSHRNAAGAKPRGRWSVRRTLNEPFRPAGEK